jgi:hypothetical protein
MGQSLDSRKAVHEIFRTLAADMRSAILNSNALHVAAREAERLIIEGEREVHAIISTGEGPFAQSHHGPGWRKPSQASENAHISPASSPGLSYNPRADKNSGRRK